MTSIKKYTYFQGKAKDFHGFPEFVEVTKKGSVN